VPIPLLDDGEDVMPAWADEFLTSSQIARSGPVWRWRCLLRKAKLNGPTKALGVCLSEHCRDMQPWCWPSLDVLEDETGYSRSALLRATALLERGAFVMVIRQKNPQNKRQQSNRYWLSWPTHPVEMVASRVTERDSASVGALLGSVSESDPGRVSESDRSDLSEFSIEFSNEYAFENASKKGIPYASGVDLLKLRCVEIFAPKGIAEDDCARVVDQLRVAGIGDVVIDEALGQCEMKRPDTLGYLVKVARDWFEQRTGAPA
jgi:hypothetical protein